MDRAAELYAESLALFRALDDERNVGELIHRQAVGAVVAGNTQMARPLLRESLEIALAVGNRWGECQALGTLAHVERADGNIERATELFTQSAAIAVEVGNVWWESNILGNLTELDLAAGRIEDADVRAHRAMTLARANGDRLMMIWGLLYFARIAAGRRNVSLAGLLWGAIQAEEARGQIGRGHDPNWDPLVAPLLAIKDPAFEPARAEGRRLGLEEAVERALAGE